MRTLLHRVRAKTVNTQKLRVSLIHLKILKILKFIIEKLKTLSFFGFIVLFKLQSNYGDCLSIIKEKYPLQVLHSIWRLLSWRHVPVCACLSTPS